MTDKRQDFDHPNVPADTPHRRYCVYAITRKAWETCDSHSG
ncbi:hypothetical protein [Oxalobacter vibrioformis]|nr:hypothetical protein [Oxalobacter vibrioformis]